MLCPTCGIALSSSLSSPHTCLRRVVGPSAPTLTTLTTRREFLLRAGLVGGALFSAPSLLAACSPTPTPAPTPTPNAFGVNWELANPYGIQLDDQGTQWHAGHVNDLLELSDETAVVVASDSGGVWLLTDSGDLAIALSREWDSPDIHCLARGPDGVSHIYAGGMSHTGISQGESYGPVTGGEAGDQGALYVTDPSAGAPLLAPWSSIPLPGIGVVRRIVTLTGATRRIVLATSNGIWWSPIPTTSGASGYSWRQAINLPVTNGDFFGLALGPSDSLMASAWPHADWQLRKGHWGLFRGEWQSSGDLSFQQITAITAVDGGPWVSLSFQASSLASCASKLNVMYAANSDDQGSLYSVLRSDDGGQSWRVLPMAVKGTSHEITELAGSGQGNGWDNCIGVSPTDENTFGVGWVYGPFLSTDGGLTCQNLQDLQGRHDDQHAIVFSQPPNAAGRMYVCSDGGVAVTSDGGASFSTSFNQKLANLQFIGPTAKRQWPGSISSDPASGVLGGGLQDNGEVYAPLAMSPLGLQPWRRLDGGDGRFFEFLSNGVALHFTNGNSVRYAAWNGTALQDKGVVPVKRAAPSGVATDGGIYAGVYVIASPGYVTDSGDRLYALGAAGNSYIYGLFDNGLGPHWDYLMTVPVGKNQGISAIASYSGNQILIGVWGAAGAAGGMIFTYATNNLNVGSLSLTAAAGSAPYVPDMAVVRDAADGSFEAYAIRNDDTTGRVYYTPTGASWFRVDSGLPGGVYFSLEIDRSTTPARVFVAADNAVYASKDKGYTWDNISRGLPKQPRCSDLSVVQMSGGQQRYLYLATYGWSLWRTPLGS